MKILCALGKFSYGTKELGLGIEFTAFSNALEQLGHEIVHFDTWDSHLREDPAELNKSLLAAIMTTDPDVVLTVQRDCEIWIETLDSIRNLTRSRTVTWVTDDSFKFHKVSRFLGKHYDLVATTYDYCIPLYRKHGIENVVLTQWAANSSWLRPPLQASECTYDVTFVGTAFGGRTAIIKELETAGVKVQCFGRGWPNGPISDEEFRNVLHRSFISLNFSAGFQGSGNRKSQMKARTFEVPGYGGLLLSEVADGLQDYFQIGKEVMTFRDKDELVSQIMRLRKSPELRDAIAKAGFLRTSQEHTYEKRFTKILSSLDSLGHRSPKSSRSPEEAALDYRKNQKVITAFSALLSRSASAIWGEDRGKRAARRAIFEASWRLMGETTFTARGLPGRIFPGV